MDKSIKKKIERQLFELDNKKLPSKGFSDYKEFLKNQHLVLLYPFEKTFLLSLIELAINCYTNKIRYNKTLLFRTLKSYYHKKENIIHFPEELVEKLFNIFKSEISSENQILDTINYLLIGQKLNHNQISFLVEHAFESSVSLNRILQYPFKNKQITCWVKYYYEDDRLRDRRIELTSWLLDEDIYFRPSNQILFDDHAYRYERDAKNFCHQCYFGTKLNPIFDRADFEENEYVNDFPNRTSEELKKEWFWTKYLYERKELDINELANFMKQTFRWSKHVFTPWNAIEPVELFKGRLMVWAIAYSRLPMNQKISCLKTEFSPDLIHSYLKVGKRLKSKELLQWLLLEVSK